MEEPPEPPGHQRKPGVGFCHHSQGIGHTETLIEHRNHSGDDRSHKAHPFFEKLHSFGREVLLHLFPENGGGVLQILTEEDIEGFRVAHSAFLNPPGKKRSHLWEILRSYGREDQSGKGDFFSYRRFFFHRENLNSVDHNVPKGSVFLNEPEGVTTPFPEFCHKILVSLHKDSPEPRLLKEMPNEPPTNVSRSKLHTKKFHPILASCSSMNRRTATKSPTPSVAPMAVTHMAPQALANRPTS